MHKYILPVFVIGLVFLATGCGKNDQAKNNLDKNIKNFGNRNFVSSTMDFPHTVGTVADLKEGIRVMVTGKTNTDGTINASRIMIGEMPGFGGEKRGGTGVRPAMPADGGQKRPEGFERPGVGQASGQARVSGEIFKMDETSLVVKEEKVGSKIVFYSDKTEIFILTAPTSTLGVNTSSTTASTTSST